MNTRILGIDPGSRVAGYGLVEIQGDDILHISHGVLQIEADRSFSERLGQLGQGLSRLLLRYQPSQVVVEKVFLGRSVDSAFKLGQARGVVLYECQRSGVPLSEYAASAVKKGVTGRGSAEKEEVRLILERLLGLSQIEWLDASDALALAWHRANCILREARLRGLEAVR
ncbi:MAG: crossover junction endodeoxyribonuclease RuvC [Bdellovibrionaceae bacterium]|nr:crossover junction endodeoxyribonuclease RuvC [Pseudobdellovibrionaceae bacterium]